MYKRFLLYQDLWICFVHRFFFFLVDERFYLFIHFINSAVSVYFFCVESFINRVDTYVNF